MELQKIRSRLSRRTVGALIMAFALFSGLGTAAVFAGLTINNEQTVSPVTSVFKLMTRDYETAWGRTTAQHVVNSGLDTGILTYDRNAVPSSGLLPPPFVKEVSSDSGDEGGVFSSFALTDNQVARLRGSILNTGSGSSQSKTTTSNSGGSSTTCDPRDANCLRQLACQGVSSLFVPRTPCTPGDLICQARRSCG